MTCLPTHIPTRENLYPPTRMSRHPDRAAGDVIRDFLAVAELLREPLFAQLYAHLAREGAATVQELTDALDLTPATADTYVTRLVDNGILEVSSDDQPRRYVAREIDLIVTATKGTREYTITPALIDAVSRRVTNDAIETYVDHHGVAGLATALTYTVDRERGQTTHRRMAQALDLAPLEAETILQAIRPVVHDHVDVESSGASVADIDDGDQETTFVPEREFRESARIANERFGEEDLDGWAPHAVDEDEPE